MSLQSDYSKIINQFPGFIVNFFSSKSEILAIKTRIGYAIDIRVFFEWLLIGLDKEKYEDIEPSDIEALNNHDIDRYMSWLSEYSIDGIEYKNSASGKKRKLAALRSLMKYLLKDGYIKHNPTELVETPKIREKEIVVLSADEQTSMMNAVEIGKDKKGRQLIFHQKTYKRDLAILTLFLGTGLRVSELVNINDSDINYREQRIWVYRKGGKEQYVYFGNEVSAALLEYAEEERASLMGYETYDDVPVNTPFFISLQKRRISARQVEIIIKKYAHSVMPANMKITPHTLRKTYGTKLYYEYKDLYLVQKALGHSSPATTEKYYTKFNPDYMKKLKEYNI